MTINKKQEMVNRVNAWMAAYEAGEADTAILENMAEVLLQVADMDKMQTSEVKELLADYEENFDSQKLEAAVGLLADAYAA